MKQYSIRIASTATALASLFVFTILTQGNTKLSTTITDSNHCIITLNSTDHPDEVWTIQMSTDLVSWEDIESLQLENGSGQIITELSQETGSSVMLRAYCEGDTVSTALNLPETPFNYSNIQLPAHLQTNQVQNEDNTPNNNPVTDHGATLGRVLFYDKKLSRNETISCSSCHLQENAFSDPEAFSTGFDGGLTGRNSMGLTNAKFYESGHFFWDERADTLEEQALMPIQDSIEMGMTLEDLVERLQPFSYYQELFQNAFGDSEVTSERIALALSQFIRSMLSYQSKFDEGVESNFSNFSALENEGRALFNSNRTRCSDCHEGPNFVGDNPSNNGLEFPFVDLGVGAITGNRADEGKFKMSSLRNVEFTAPYMHDGRFETLEEVIEHYHNGIVANPNLGNELERMGNGSNQGNFSEREKAALVAFLKTLTDEAFITDPKFSDPFKSN